jgi:hypothetical protein
VNPSVVSVSVEIAEAVEMAAATRRRALALRRESDRLYEVAKSIERQIAEHKAAVKDSVKLQAGAGDPSGVPVSDAPEPAADVQAQAN